MTGVSCHLVAILLGHMKLSIGQIRSAVLACDETVLSEQHLRQMESFAPSNPEVGGQCGRLTQFCPMNLSCAVYLYSLLLCQAMQCQVVLLLVCSLYKVRVQPLGVGHGGPVFM